MAQGGSGGKGTTSRQPAPHPAWRPPCITTLSLLPLCAGKSTLLRLLMGREQPLAGQVREGGGLGGGKGSSWQAKWVGQGVRVVVSIVIDINKLSLCLAELPHQTLCSIACPAHLSFLRPSSEITALNSSKQLVPQCCLRYSQAAVSRCAQSPSA